MPCTLIYAECIASQEDLARRNGRNFPVGVLHTNTLTQPLFDNKEWAGFVALRATRLKEPSPLEIVFCGARYRFVNYAGEQAPCRFSPKQRKTIAPLVIVFFNAKHSFVNYGGDICFAIFITFCSLRFWLLLNIEHYIDKVGLFGLLSMEWHFNFIALLIG